MAKCFNGNAAVVDFNRISFEYLIDDKLFQQCDSDTELDIYDCLKDDWWKYDEFWSSYFEKKANRKRLQSKKKNKIKNDKRRIS